jgi:hypothetical protein
MLPIVLLAAVLAAAVMQNAALLSLTGLLGFSNHASGTQSHAMSFLDTYKFY